MPSAWLLLTDPEMDGNYDTMWPIESGIRGCFASLADLLEVVPCTHKRGRWVVGGDGAEWECKTSGCNEPWRAEGWEVTTFVTEKVTTS